MSESIEQYIYITPSQMTGYAWWLMQQKISFWVHGSPGVAKSISLAKLCREKTVVFKDDRLSQVESVDLRGLLDIDREKGTSKWMIPESFPKEGCPNTFWFLDELPDADPAVIKAAYQLVHDRQIGDYRLPDNVSVGAAGNLITDMSMVGRTPAAFNNRFCHLYIRPTVEDWLREAAIPGKFNPMVMAFLQWKPSWLHAFHGMPRDELVQMIRNSDAWHSCRTWEYVSRVVDDFGTDERSVKKAFPLIAGFVGLSAATEFRGYVQYYSQLPDIDTLIEHPESFRLPTELPVQWALASAVSLKITRNNLENVMKFAHKLPPEMQTGMIVAAYNRDSSVSDNDSFAAWAVKQSIHLF